MSLNDRIIATIRTGVPALIGFLLAKLIAAVPAVADVIAFIDANFTLVLAGIPVVEVLKGAAVAGVIAGYYWLARKIGDSYPSLEKWLLGSKLVPVYTVESSKGQ